LVQQGEVARRNACWRWFLLFVQVRFSLVIVLELELVLDVEFRNEVEFDRAG
jgi:hypothetical protein